ncbi:hypothetical protein [Candidatus Viridilinea mediisalina]|uniref:hypothetical protein n=1 Tax=Candidatus Viridilinea mediisalina TaxID=2024553 RepID=UPI0013FE451F|nr:hypothetical protein [Candidatus Viridilinea mediisalina]
MPPSPQRVTLSLVGLAAVGASLWVAFEQPYTIWPWLLLLVGLGCAILAQRMA